MQNISPKNLQKMTSEIIKLRKRAGNIDSLEREIKDLQLQINKFRKERLIWGKLLLDAYNCLCNKKLTNIFVKRRLKAHLFRFSKLK